MAAPPPPPPPVTEEFPVGDTFGPPPEMAPPAPAIPPPPPPDLPPEIQMGGDPPMGDMFGPPPPRPVAPVAAQPPVRRPEFVEEAPIEDILGRPTLPPPSVPPPSPVPPRTVEPPDFGGPEELFGYPADRGPADVPPDVAAVAPLTAAAMPTPTPTPTATPTPTPTPTTPPRPPDLPPGVPWIPGGWKKGMKDPFDSSNWIPDPTKEGAGGEQQVGLDPVFGGPIDPDIEVEGPDVGRRPEQRVDVDTDAVTAAKEKREEDRIETADPEAAKEAARQADARRKAAREAQEAHAAQVAQAAAAQATTAPPPSLTKLSPQPTASPLLMPPPPPPPPPTGSLFAGGFDPNAMPTTAAQFTQAGNAGAASMLNRMNTVVEPKKYFQEGGIIEELSQDETTSQVLQMVAQALQTPDDPQAAEIISGFEEAFGEEALMELIQLISGGAEMPAGADEGLQMPGPVPAAPAMLPTTPPAMLPAAPPMQVGGLIPGSGDAMADDIITVADEGTPDAQKIAVSSGEYVVAGDVVSGLGSGNTDAGAEVLDQLQEDVRMARTGTNGQPPPMDLSEVLPATYGGRYA